VKLEESILCKSTLTFQINKQTNKRERKEVNTSLLSSNKQTNKKSVI